MQLIRQIFCFFSLVAFIFSCNEPPVDKTEKVQKEVHVLKDLLQLIPSEGKVYFKNEPFTGFAVTLYQHKKFESKTQYINGEKESLSKKWFDDGTLSFEANYSNGKLHGTSSSWWKNGNKRSESNYINGVAQGVQFQWYQSGVKFKKLNLVDGKEQGLQQSWRENGKIYNNYEAKNGRIFGLKRATLCYELDGQEIKIKQ